jgi:hypothetical protein
MSDLLKHLRRASFARELGWHAMLVGVLTIVVVLTKAAGILEFLPGTARIVVRHIFGV